MGFHEKMLALAARVATLRNDKRAFRLGAVGLRKDGCLVTACNIPCTAPNAKAHAEIRLAAKLDRGSTVYVARVARDGSWATAKPCWDCLCCISARGVKRVFWTTKEGFSCAWI